MSDEERLRRETREQLAAFPHTQKMAPHQGTYFERTTVNNEIDRINEENRRRDEERRRNGG